MREKKSRGVDNRRMKEDQTIVLSVRLKPSTIGNIARFISDNGMKVTSAAGLLKDALEIMEQNTKVEKFASERSALDYLESIGILHRDYMSKKNTQKVAQCLALDNVLLERKITGSKDFQKKLAEAQRLMATTSDEEFRRMMSENDADKNAGAIAPMIPDSMDDLVVDSDEDQ